MLVWCTDLLVLTTPIIIIVLIMIALEIIPIMIMSLFLDKVFKIFTSDKKLKCKLNIKQKRWEMDLHRYPLGSEQWKILFLQWIIIE